MKQHSLKDYFSSPASSSLSSQPSSSSAKVAACHYKRKRNSSTDNIPLHKNNSDDRSDCRKIKQASVTTKDDESNTSYFMSKQNPSSLMLTASSKRVRIGAAGSRFGDCPLCGERFPFHILEKHAGVCQGQQQQKQQRDDGSPYKSRNNKQTASPSKRVIPLNNNNKLTKEYEQPIPGLFLYKDFVTAEEENQIILELDGKSTSHQHEFLPWKYGTFNGPHNGKRWGVHCNLRDRKVSAPEHPLPHFIQEIIMSKLAQLKLPTGQTFTSCSNNKQSKSIMIIRPNEANAIDYRKKLGHYLQSHVDDRKLSKEPIVNLSLAGDCYMTFRNEAQHRNTCVKEQRVFLPRRTLQVLTGKARYDFSHGICKEDIVSERRVSVTMRESPLTNSKMDGN